MKKKGFTLVEIIVVMAIISVLTLIVVGAIIGARRAMNNTRARSEMRDIIAQFQAYSMKYGQFPLIGDTYTISAPTSNETAWKNVVNDLVIKGFITQETADEFYYDPWGTAYAFDDNFGGGTNSTMSLFCSLGPNKIFGNDGTISWMSAGDDVCSNIKHEGICLSGFGSCTP